MQKNSIFKKNLKKIENKFNEYAQLPKRLEYYFKNKIILDAGSGTGRFSYIVKKFRPKMLFSVDFSKEATIQTQQNLIPLNQNIIIIRADLNKVIKVPVNKNQQLALLSLRYNIGGDAFNKSSLLRELNTRNYTGAALRFAEWRLSEGKINQGLVNRRERERQLFSKPV